MVLVGEEVNVNMDHNTIQQNQYNNKEEFPLFWVESVL